MIKFWNIKAKTYPKPFDIKNIKNTYNILEKIKKLGISFKNKTLIDIGCGTGIYGLVLVREAKKVFCLDFSKKMISTLREEARKNDIANIDSRIVSFQNFRIDGMEKEFDISFASMTPAIKTIEDVIKMEKLCKEFCVFIGWAGKRENYIADEIMAAHNIKPFYPKGFFDVREILIKRKKNFKQKIFETSWVWEGQIEDAIEDFSARIELENIEPNKKLIKNILISKFPDGNISMETSATEGILVWKPSMMR